MIYRKTKPRYIQDGLKRSNATNPVTARVTEDLSFYH